jgi:putative drug exporter of the RND superfamily
VAGVAPAGSFAMLAIVPIAPFRQFAVATGIGIVIDTFIVRPLLVPALLTMFGERSWWPSKHGRDTRVVGSLSPSRVERQQTPIRERGT